MSWANASPPNLTGAAIASRVAAAGSATVRANLRTALQDGGYAYKIHPLETAAGWVEANLTFGFLPWDLRRYGVVGDGVTDDTATLNTIFSRMAGRYIMPANFSPLITGTVTVPLADTFIEGCSSMLGSWFLVNPPNNAGMDALKFSAGAAVLYRCGLKNLGFKTGNSNQKNYIVASDTSALEIENVQVYQAAASTSSNSVGLYLKGRELTNIHNFEAQTDFPLKIGVNPNSASLSCDHLKVDGINLLRPIPIANYGVTCDDNVNLSNVTLDGIAYVGGGGAFYWKNTLAAQASYALTFRNSRVEQTATAANHSFHIEGTGANYFQQVQFDNVRLDTAQNGVYARQVWWLGFTNCMNPTTTKEALNVDSTVLNISLVNCATQAGATATLTGQVLRAALLEYGAGPLPDTGFYSSTGSQQYAYGRLGPQVCTDVFGLGNAATAPDPGAGGTIATANTANPRVNPVAARTGVILAVGTAPGQVARVTNIAAYGSGFSITFAAVATSHVSGGTAIVIAAGTFKDFVWDVAQAAWYPSG